jgi:hypothetical protein
MRVIRFGVDLGQVPGIKASPGKPVIFKRLQGAGTPKKLRRRAFLAGCRQDDLAMDQKI